MPLLNAWCCDKPEWQEMKNSLLIGIPIAVPITMEVGLFTAITLLTQISHRDSEFRVKLAKQGEWWNRSHERPYREVWAGLRAKQGLHSAEGRSSEEA